MSARLSAMVQAALDNGLRGRPTPLVLLVEPTHLCNASCAFCYHWKESTENEMPLERQLELLEEGWKLGTRFLYVSGGEPTLYPHLDQLLIEARRLGYWNSMTTNGSTLVRKATKLAPLLDSVTVSVDYPDSRHDRLRTHKGLFEKAVRGLVAAKARGIQTRINMSLGQDNRDDIPEMLELAHNVGAALHVRLLTREAPDIQANTLTWPQARDVARELMKLKTSRPDVLTTPTAYLRHLIRKKPFHCRLLSLLVTVDAQGRVYPTCPKYESEKERLAGELGRQTLEEAWHSPQAEAIRKDAAVCKPMLDCYTSCILDISLLAGLSPEMLWEQMLGSRSLLNHFRGRNV